MEHHKTKATWVSATEFLEEKNNFDRCTKNANNFLWVVLKTLFHVEVEARMVLDTWDQDLISKLIS